VADYQGKSMLSFPTRWLAGLLARPRRSSTRRSSPRKVLRLEGLEGRCVPANLYVTSSADNANQPGTLRDDLAHASAGDSILIQVSSITLTQGELLVNTPDVSISPLLTAQNPNARVAINDGNNHGV
jgi:hypothetical protein